MPDTDHPFDVQESSFARLAGRVFKAAHDRALANGGSVAVLENGAIWEKFANGQKKFIQRVAPAVAVKIGARFVRRPGDSPSKYQKAGHPSYDPRLK